MDELDFFEIDSKYIEYLSGFEPHLFHNKKITQNFSRKYVGIILKINGFDYFAPLSSFKEKHKKLSETLDFIHLNKTAVLFRLAVRVGAIAANADAEDRAQAEYEDRKNNSSEDNRESYDSVDSDDTSTKERKAANDIMRTMKKLDSTLMSKFFEFEDEEAAVLAAKELVTNLQEYIINPFLGIEK